MRGEPQNLASLGESEVTVALEDLGNFLVSLRKQQGITQHELAQRLGVYLEAVNRMERTGYQTVSLARLVTIAAALGVRVTVPTAADSLYVPTTLPGPTT